MSFFNKIVNDIDDVEQEFLGPDYKYYEKISSPGDLNMSSHGSITALSNDIAGIVNYVELLVSGSGRGSKTRQPLGNKFFIKTGGQCKDYKTNKLVTRSMYIDNVPSSDIPIISNISGMSFPEFRGLIPSIIQDLYSINPVKMFRAFMEGNEPKCAEVSLQVIDKDDNKSNKTAYIPIVELMDLENDGKIPRGTVTKDMRSSLENNTNNISNNTSNNTSNNKIKNNASNNKDNIETFLNICNSINNNDTNVEIKNNSIIKNLDSMSNIYILSISLIFFYIMYRTMKK